jgi:hypothetical protein
MAPWDVRVLITAWMEDVKPSMCMINTTSPTTQLFLQILLILTKIPPCIGPTMSEVLRSAAANSMTSSVSPGTAFGCVADAAGVIPTNVDTDAIKNRVLVRRPVIQ